MEFQSLGTRPLEQMAQRFGNLTQGTHYESRNELNTQSCFNVKKQSTLSVSSHPLPSIKLKKTKFNEHHVCQSIKPFQPSAVHPDDQHQFFHCQNQLTLYANSNLDANKISPSISPCSSSSSLSGPTLGKTVPSYWIKDYANPNIKPPFSYITLIVSAMNSKSLKRITLNEIYTWIISTFAYYCKNTRRWQNSIRHALSFNDCFIKISRPSGEPGKGCYWTLHPKAVDMFDNGSSMRRNKKFVDESRFSVHHQLVAKKVRTNNGFRNALPPTTTVMTTTAYGQDENLANPSELVDTSSVATNLAQINAAPRSCTSISPFYANCLTWSDQSSKCFSQHRSDTNYPIGWNYPSVSCDPNYMTGFDLTYCKSGSLDCDEKPKECFDGSQTISNRYMHQSDIKSQWFFNSDLS